jgi:hypothetical protein
VSLLVLIGSKVRDAPGTGPGEAARVVGVEGRNRPRTPSSGTSGGAAAAGETS